jgi:hypothetical protein
MQRKLFFLVWVAFCAVLATGSAPDTAPEKGTPPDSDALAQKLVTRSAGVHEGDIVLRANVQTMGFAGAV